MLNAFRINLSILIMAILMVSRVVSANKILLKRIESGSRRDVLSGALNRRAFLAQLSRLCTEREGMPPVRWPSCFLISITLKDQ